jgi:3',5'-cyclic AMP phosphodiesterase CpdA
MFKVIHISDTHLRENDPGSRSGWAEATRAIKKARPDLVIHTGDIVLAEPENAMDHAFAKGELSRLDVEWLAIPGNHDIGDGPPRSAFIRDDLLQRFETNYGSAHWTRDIAGWSLIGINSMLFGLGSQKETEEWAWLEGALQRARGPSIALFMHKPPFVVAPDEVEEGSAAIPVETRSRFWDLVTRFGVRVVACGHRHEYRVLHRDGVSVVWAPTTGDQLDERTAPVDRPVAFPGVLEMIFHGETFMHRLIPFGAGGQSA